jgi:hypothetical protein
MENRPTRFLLFLRFYAPLFVILAIRDSFKNRMMALRWTVRGRTWIWGWNCSITYSPRVQRRDETA